MANNGQSDVGDSGTARETTLFRMVKCESFTVEAGQGMAMSSGDYMILLVAGGSGAALLENRQAMLELGTVLLLHPHAICRLEAGAGGASGYRIDFEAAGRQVRLGDKTGVTALDEWLASWTHPLGDAAAGLLPEAEHLHRCEAEQDELDRLDRQVRFQRLLLSLLRSSRGAAICERTARQAVARSVAYVRDHYSEPLTIGRLADMAATNRWRYTQLFKEETGQLPIDFLNTVRIDKAQQMLLLTDNKLKEIANAVGYSNEYYFNRKFKQKIGVTPGQYRNRNSGTTRIFAPFLEDYLVALGVTPILQCMHRPWGRQDYLGLYGVPDFDIASDDWTVLSGHQPEFILLDDGYRRWGMERYSRISPVFKIPFNGEDWRFMLRSIGNVLGRQRQASEATERLEHQIADARQRLERSAAGQSVAVLRISGRSVALYGGSACGYTGPLLYRGLGLSEPAIVRNMAPGVRRIELSWEQLEELDADHLFVTFEGEDGGRELLHSGIWKSLRAVRANQVYEVDFMAWMNYGVLSHGRKINDVLQVMGG
ncbi:AraC family transcriptional regulator [Cohnella hashimotonis]|uniref:AraC family transcriptional regulator n=1 Tax=Cohnella hashimotonis TaxID=2826895 RepID=A0ABT6TEM5_9BACL|nr:AraC family transcriptional regulator [Cohnella hashimotonis]MDI4645209.1 AraC family transcriptional regulator [Cohnella hashimotonis]